MDTDHAKAVQDVFDEWAQAGRDEGMAERHGLSARPVLTRVDLAPGDAFLDLGAGNAWAARWAQASGARAVGVDVSQRMLARARRSGQGAALARASFEALCFADASFDIVFSMEALYYAKDLERALVEAFRVAKAGGVLHVLVDYYEENPASHGWPEKTGLSMHRLSQAGWQRTLEEAGFRDVATERVRSQEGEGWRAEHGSLHVHGVKP